MPRAHRVLNASLTASLVAAPAWADHPQNFDRAAKAFLRTRDLGKAEKPFLPDATRPGRNQLLCLYELASLRRWAGDWEGSAARFAQADQLARQREGRAVVSVTGGLGQAGATLGNDQLLPWEGAAFDQVMARTLNAMNFLARKDLEGARVEVRKAEEYQIQERARIQGQVQRAEATPGLDAPALAAAYSGLRSFAREVRNSYENAFTYYLSSQIYRAQGEAGLNDALVDIKRAYALAPSVPAIRTAYAELVARAQGAAALEDLRGAVGPLPAPADARATGTVVVLYEAGLAPRLSEVAIDLPLTKERPDGTVETNLLSLAFPIYRDLGGPEPPLQLSWASGTQRTCLVSNLRVLACKALEERLPLILARGVLGAAAKLEGQKKAEAVGGFLGGLAALIATKVMTRADLRSWLSLPAEIQAAQFALPPGPLELTLNPGTWGDQVAVEVAAGGTTFVMVRAFPGFRTVHAVTLAGASVRPGSPPAPTP